MKLAYMKTNIGVVIIKKECDVLKPKKNLKVLRRPREQSTSHLVEKLVMLVRIIQRLVVGITGNI